MKPKEDIIEDLELIIYGAQEPSHGHKITPAYQDMKNNLIIIESIATELIRDLKEET